MTKKKMSNLQSKVRLEGAKVELFFILEIKMAVV